MAVGQLRGRLGIAVFIEVFHDDGAFEFVELVHCSRKSKTRLASASSMLLQGEADVNDNVSPDLDVGDMFEADPLEDAAEIDLAHEHVMFAVGLHDFPGNSKAHQSSPLSWSARRLLR